MDVGCVSLGIRPMGTEVMGWVCFVSDFKLLREVEVRGEFHMSVPGKGMVMVGKQQKCRNFLYKRGSGLERVSRNASYTI